MLKGNALKNAFLNSGFSEKADKKRNFSRKIKCRACGTEMIRHEGTNVIACPNCDASFILTDK
jgi:hypothetical protein